MKRLLFILWGLLLCQVSADGARKETLFNDNWWFRMNYEASKRSGRRVELPHTWNVQDALAGKDDYFRGLGNYSKRLMVPSDWKGQRIFLKFDGVNTVATLFVNGNYVGEHRGGYTAFVFELTDRVKYGEENEILVRVDNALQLDVMPLVGDFNYYGGIYRDVRLLVTDEVCISPLDYASSGVYLAQSEVSRERAKVDARVLLANSAAEPKPVTLNMEVRDGDKVVLSKKQKVTVPAGATDYATVLPVEIKRPHLWNGVKDPFMYEVTVRVEGNDGSEIDRVSQPLGLRYFSVDPNKGFFLNGEHLQLRGVCRHQDRNEVGNALRPWHHEEDVAIMREMGVNSIRLSHYPQAPYIYELLDRNGIVAWSEIPFVGPGGYLDVGFVNSPEFKANGRQQLKEMIRQNFNHPSVCFWGLFNELKMDDSPIPYIRELNELAHAEDPSRLTTSASFFDGEINEVTDLIGWNKYFGWYGNTPADMGKWADAVHKANPKFRISVSEYGAGASIYHHTDTLVTPSPSSPWHPEAWQTYYHIENWKVLKERQYLWGTFLWVMFDFGTGIRNEGDTKGRNDKGIVTIDRRIKKDAFYFYKANWNTDEPTVYIAERRHLNRTKPVIPVTVFSNRGDVELFVNGKSCGVKSPDDVATVVWEEVALQPGENRIEVVAQNGGNPLTDSCIWSLQK